MENKPAQLDSIFHALADPTRRAVVQRLVRGPAPISELAAPFAMALPSFMKHVGVLERSGLITSQKQGRVRTCELVADRMAYAERWFDEQLRIWESRYANLDKLLNDLDGESNA